MRLVAEYPIFGIGRLALPVWDQRNEAVQSVSHPNCEAATGMENRANLPHPPSREGRLPPAGGTLLSPFDGYIFRRSGQAVAGMLFSLFQRNSVPSLHMRCMITASRRASATIAFLRPRRFATFIAQAFSHDHFFTRVNMT